MSSDVRLFKVDPSQWKADAVTEINFAEVGFRERRDIQEWIADNPSILGEELLIIAKEFSGFDKTNERADLVAVDRDGKVVVIELKRDGTGANVHWQAIKYASYFQNPKSDTIVRMLADYTGIPDSDAATELKSHLESDDLDLLNRDQRIILVSHRFAPEVTSAVIWLNQQTTTESLITCVQLTPYHDHGTEAFFIQASTIFPIVGTEQFTIGPGTGSPTKNGTLGGGPVKKEDDITRLLREVASLAVEGLPQELVLNKKSRWAGVGTENRYFHLWFTRPPWSGWGMFYQFQLFAKASDGTVQVNSSYTCQKDYLIQREGFSEDDIGQIKGLLETLEVHPEQEIGDSAKWLSFRITENGNPEKDGFKWPVAQNLRGIIEAITPIIEEFVNERNEQ